ncbi:MAG: threonine synthase [Fidelibacterota bacterium]|nr:MAG: threonine synthase [Candidatus Neomarinimicrobiota bacterium]
MSQTLACNTCGERAEFKPETVCPSCFNPLEVSYDYDTLREQLRTVEIEGRPTTMWRYRELLPALEGGIPDSPVGWTPLIRARRLGKALGMPNLYVKNDAVNFPSLSFKDRVVSVALAKAVDFGFRKVGCASTGNLANAVGAQATMLDLESVILIPEDLEPPKILASACYKTQVVKVKGTYDDVNRLCTELTYRENLGIVNVNLRPFYSEGSKTVGFEIAEQLGWRLPDQVVVPMAGGSLISKIGKAFRELAQVGLVADKPAGIFGAQATGCAPIATLVKNGSEELVPVKPDTQVKSLSIGAPADGHRAAGIIRDSGGWAEDVSDEETVAGITLLAETEGIFTEGAGGVTVAVTKKLLEQRRLQRDALTVLCITGNGLKTPDLVTHRTEDLPVIEPKYSSYTTLVTNREEVAYAGKD